MTRSTPTPGSATSPPTVRDTGGRLAIPGAGSVDDTLAFIRPWGFDLAAIDVPVLLTYGDADTSCPPAHGQFLARAIPTTVVVELHDGGHFAADPTAETLSTHRWLAGGALDYPGQR